MSIIDTLFGKKKTFNHPVIGILKSQRVKGNDRTKDYSWYGSVILNNKTQETAIILEGNNTSPFSNHLAFISQLIQNWQSDYFPKIETKINETKINKNGEYGNWKKDYYIATVYPINGKSTEFELILEPLDVAKTDAVGIEIKNNSITKVYTI